jgi:hypothetical protein
LPCASAALALLAVAFLDLAFMALAFLGLAGMVEPPERIGGGASLDSLQTCL